MSAKKLILTLTAVLLAGGVWAQADAEDVLTLATAELQKYWQAITGDAENIPVRLAIDPSVSTSGNDAYTIKSAAHEAKITGSNGRSVLYGVYDLLERRGGCGWFWDGDRVPKKKSIDVSGLNVREESKFAYRGIRYFAHRGLTRFQAEHWGPEEWKREIDWLCKKRLNLFMLRIGQDDFFQKAFPDVCAYPDASKPLPGQGEIYNNRSLFWPLEFRGKLRKQILDYAFARGLMAPEDFGTMTHWYSPTPQDFLDKMKPEFLPQSSKGYSEPSLLVWDIRNPTWMESYWKITDAAIRCYGRPDILHTIGVAERTMSADPKENRQRKIDWTNKLLADAKSRYPKATRLLAGWDLYTMKKPEEAKAFLAQIPSDVILWDYEADAYSHTNFTEWDVIGKRPYTFGVFMAYEAGLDMRTDYDLLAARQKRIADDPMCKGYILWPESSHVDSLGIEWFARNSWRADAPQIEPLIETYCAQRYPDDAQVMADLWRKTLPISTNMVERWRKNAYLTIFREFGENHLRTGLVKDWVAKDPAFFAELPTVVRTLKKMDWDKDPLLRRDLVDIARVWADRLAVDAECRFVQAYLRWLNGDETAKEETLHAASVVRARLVALAAVLAQHEDFSLCDTYARVQKIHPVTNPNFASVLIDNAANFYCASHQAELAYALYIPAFDGYVDLIKERMRAGDRRTPERRCLEPYRQRALKLSFDDLRLQTPRTRRNFRLALEEVLRAAGPTPCETVPRARLDLTDKEGRFWWRERHAEKLAEIVSGPKRYDVVFLGDSITEFWETHPSNGWETVTKTWRTLNLGFRGDRVQNTIWRALHGELEGYQATKIVILLGVNNHNWRLERSTPEETVAGLERLLAIIREKQPAAEIELMGLLPCGTSAQDERAETARRNALANPLLQSLAKRWGVRFTDLSEKFRDPTTGLARKDLFRDGIHPNAAGYAIWRTALVEMLKVHPMTPPPPLAPGDRTTWEKSRRSEILATFTTNVFGRRPVERPPSLRFSAIAPDGEALDGKAIRRRTRLSFEGPFGKGSFDVLMFLPKARKRAVPAFLWIALGQRLCKDGFDPAQTECLPRWPVGEIIDRGFAAVMFDNWSVTVDRPTVCFTNGVFACWNDLPLRAPDAWGAISAWAWGASRVMDYLETLPEIDATHVAVLGHSRGGKTALWAGATDPRFAYVISNDSGCSGAKLNHMDLPNSEHIDRINRHFPHWFAENYRQWSGREKDLPFDQHQLLALIAPRLLAIGSAADDTHAGPQGELESARLASAAWELYGLKGLAEQAGSISYHIRPGGHDLTPADWQVYLDFATHHGW